MLFDKEYSCCLTGCYCDWGVDDAMNKCYDFIRKGWTIRDFIEDMLNGFFNYWYEDRSRDAEDDEVEEFLEANEYEFYKDGRRAVC